MNSVTLRNNLGYFPYGIRTTQPPPPQREKERERAKTRLETRPTVETHVMLGGGGHETLNPCHARGGAYPMGWGGGGDREDLGPGTYIYRYIYR